MKRMVFALALFWTSIAAAQTSASFKLQEYIFNAGGNPTGGATPSSASRHITLDAVAEDVVGAALESASFHMDGCFVGAYPPPGEVTNQFFTNKTTLVWDAEKSVGDYNLYRDLLSSLSGLGFGACLQSEVASETATDVDVPAVGQGFFYLVTAENRLDEEGTKGFQTNGSERANAAPCP